jgi:hypothetical protein
MAKDKPKPLTEIQLMDLQTKLLACRDEDTWQGMFTIMISYSRSLLLKINKGKVYLEPSHVLGVATDAAIKIMRRYTEDPSFKIDASFAGLLHWKVIESLYGNYEEETNVSWNHIISTESGHVTELGDLQSILDDSELDAMKRYEPDYNVLSTEVLSNIVTTVIKDFDGAVDNYRLSLLGRAFVLLILRQPRARKAPEAFKQHLAKNTKEEEVLDLLLLEIKAKMSESSR